MTDKEYRENLTDACYGRSFDDMLVWAHERNYPYHIVRCFLINNYNISDMDVIKGMADFLNKPRIVTFLPSKCACCGAFITPIKPIPVYDYEPLAPWRIEEQISFI